jgi:hypothetical protein
MVELGFFGLLGRENSYCVMACVASTNRGIRKKMEGCMIVQAESACSQRVLAALDEILDDLCERRTEERIAYFAPVTVGLLESPQVGMPAFVRDLSLSGIGLVHLMPLKRGEVVVDLPLPRGSSVKLRTEILWCRDYEDGWYASGGRFLDVT